MPASSSSKAGWCSATPSTFCRAHVCWRGKRPGRKCPPSLRKAESCTAPPPAASLPPSRGPPSLPGTLPQGSDPFSRNWGRGVFLSLCSSPPWATVGQRIRFNQPNVEERAKLDGTLCPSFQATGKLVGDRLCGALLGPLLVPLPQQNNRHRSLPLPLREQHRAKPSGAR